MVTVSYDKASVGERGGDQDSLGDLDEAAGRRGMQRSPALVVSLVDVTAALHQELNHLGVLVDAGLTNTHTHTQMVGLYHRDSPEGLNFFRSISKSANLNCFLLVA